MILKDDFSFMKKQQIDENKNHSLTDEDRARM